MATKRAPSLQKPTRHFAAGGLTTDPTTLHTPGSYTPTAGEQKMLGDFDNRMAEFGIKGAGAGTASITEQNTSQAALKANAAPGSGYTKADGTIGYQPTAGEEKMLGDFDSRMAAFETKGGAAGTTSITPDSADDEEKPPVAKDPWKPYQYEPTRRPAVMPRLAFADGGKIDPDELMRQMSAKYGAPAASPATQQPAPQPAPAPVQQQQSQSQQGPASGIFGIFKGRAAQIDKAAGYANGGKIAGRQIDRNGQSGAEMAAFGLTVGRGGKIEGPGTPTSDSIPAQVRETGESIRVSTQERILSKLQDAFLEEIAQASGFDSLNAMLEAGTGKPVGPTIVAGKRAAATGMDPDYTYDPALDAQVKQRAADTHEANRIVNETGPYNSSRLPSDPAPVALDAIGRTPDGSMPGSLGSTALMDKPAAAGGLSPNYVAASIAAPPTLGGTQYGRAGSSGPLTNAAAAGATANSAKNDVGYRPEINGITWNAKGFDPTKQTMAQGTGAIAVTSGPNAGKNVVIGPQDYTAADGSSTSDWSKTAQYAQGMAQAQKDRDTAAMMQRTRLERDANDPTITDSNVRNNARLQLQDLDVKAAKQGETYGRLLDNQTKLTKLASEGQMTALQSQYLAEADPVRREALAERIRGVSGKGTAAAPINLQHVDTEKGTMLFDPRTGRMVPAVGADGSPVGSGKALTEYQGKSTGFGMRADAASKVIDSVGQGGKVQPSLIKRAAESVPLVGEGLGMAANRFASPEQQQVEQAQRDFINAVLRQESGAAISASEFDNARKQYFAQPNDSQEVVAQKKANREMAINGFRVSAGPGGKNIGGAPSQSQPQTQQQPAAAPKVGMVDGKHVFLGGNPADPASWAEVR